MVVSVTYHNHSNSLSRVKNSFRNTCFILLKMLKATVKEKTKQNKMYPPFPEKNYQS